jgi:hypothetical protein
MNIKFTNAFASVDLSKYRPVPASQNIPEWYQDTEPYVNKDKDFLTIKRCIPVLDAISTGYLILLPCDILVQRNNGIPKLTVYGDADPRFEPYSHSIEQASNYPNSKIYPFLKWMNPWGIETHNGYSSVFITPMHRDLPFRILEGVVDTDKFIEPVNFPFLLDDKFIGIIKAGTPIAQVVPFKRESFTMVFGDSIDIELMKSNSNKMLGYKNSGYKKLFWKKKDYK